MNAASLVGVEGMQAETARPRGSAGPPTVRHSRQATIGRSAHADQIQRSRPS
jgi:hypothetical protein